MITANSEPQQEAATESMDLDQRVSLSMAFGSYASAEQEFNRSSRRFTEACKSLRKLLPPGKRLVIRHDYKHFLIETDAEGNFDIEPVESL